MASVTKKIGKEVKLHKDGATIAQKLGYAFTWLKRHLKPSKKAEKVSSTTVANTEISDKPVTEYPASEEK